MQIQELIKRARFGLPRWAQLAGVPYDSVRQWASGHRTPEAENIEALADGLERFVREDADDIVSGLRKAADARRQGL